MERRKEENGEEEEEDGGEESDSGSLSDDNQVDDDSEEEEEEDDESEQSEDEKDDNSDQSDLNFLEKGNLGDLEEDEEEPNEDQQETGHENDEEEVKEDSDEEEEVNLQSSENRIENMLKPKSRSDRVAHLDEYDYDSSDEEDLRNTIGNVPIDWYNEYPHIGYDWDGKKIAKPKKEGEMDDFLRKLEDPFYWRTVKDRITGQNVVLTDEDVDLIERLKKGEYPDPNYDAYQPFIDFFTYEKMIHPVTNRPETKASFIPSLSEKRKVSKMVSRIKRSWQRPKVEKKKAEQFQFDYDLWEKEDKPNKRMGRYIPAPKVKLPGHEQSYNPPPEYLLSKEEEEKWRQQEPEERRINALPKKYARLRSVPAYPEFVKERFERCLDLYLCPRARKLRANVDPEDLIPKLPKPRELQPFPCIESMVYIGHQGIVRCLCVEPKGQFIASGSDDCAVKIWEVLTGRCLKTLVFEEAVKCIAWCPDESKCLCAIAVNKELFIINPGVGDRMVVSDTDMLFKTSLESEPGVPEATPQSSDPSIVDWQTVDDEAGASIQWKSGVRVTVKHRFEVKQITWHHRGDYFAAVMPSGGNKSVVIHQLSKKRSQVPFRKSKGIIQCVLFHPSRPFFFVATQRYVRIYNLVKQELSKKLMTNCKYVSSLAIHNGGDNVIVGSYDLRLTWFDLDLSTKPYKTLRYHKKAIRKVAFHPKYPLFASASDDGTAIVSHGMVYSDLLQNPLIVPVKVLRGHKIVEDLGVLDCSFHPNQPWLFTAGADGTLRLFT